MSALFQVIEMSVADARRAEALLANGARSTVVTDPQRFLAKFALWRSLGKVRVVREMPVRALAARSTAA